MVPAEYHFLHFQSYLFYYVFYSVLSFSFLFNTSIRWHSFMLCGSLYLHPFLLPQLPLSIVASPPLTLHLSFSISPSVFIYNSISCSRFLFFPPLSHSLSYPWLQHSTILHKTTEPYTILITILCIHIHDVLYCTVLYGRVTNVPDILLRNGVG